MCVGHIIIDQVLGMFMIIARVTKWPKILFCELLLTGVVLEDDKNSGSTLEETEVVAR